MNKITGAPGPLRPSIPGALPQSNCSLGDRHETPQQRTLSDSPFLVLLWPGANAKANEIAAWRSPRRRRASSERIPRTPVTGRNAETAEAQDRRAGQEMRSLPRRVHGLQRCRARPQRAEGNGRSLAGRPSRQRSSNALVVQWRERVNQDGRLTADQPTNLASDSESE